MKKIAFILIFLNALFCFGQTPDYMPRFFPLSPNAASLEKFDNFPVSHYTGVADISVPLYTVQSGDLEIPITLKYNSSGIRVTERASWVGLGWSLDAGPSITRKIMGNADDSGGGHGYFDGYLKSEGYYYTFPDDISYLNYVSRNIFDTEPDIYSYNTLNSSGKFFFDGQHSFAVSKIPYSPDSIMYSFNTNGLIFDLLDKSGNQYSFGKTTNAYDYTYSSETSSGGITSWHLDNLISANKSDTITFAYARQEYSTTDYSYYYTIEDLQHQPSNPDNWASSTHQQVHNSTIKESLPSTITFNGGKVEFVRSTTTRSDITGAKSLDSIKIYSYNFSSHTYTLEKTIKFFYSYFSSNRLKLDSVRFYGSDNSLIDTYSFEYNTTVNLPTIYTKQCDEWGYYNGVTCSMIPQTIIDVTYPSGSTVDKTIGNAMNVDPVKAQANILKKVYYPTGGYTEFEYESNRYTEGSVTHLVGGLRIKSMKSYTSSTATPVVKTYSYGNGQKICIDNDYSYSTEKIFRVLEGGEVIYRVRTFTSCPVADIVPYDGSIVVYPSVTEYIGNDISNTGKTTYEYAYYSDSYNTGNVSKVRRISRFYKRGQLLHRTDYRVDNGDYYPVREELYHYNNSLFPQKSYYDVGLVAEGGYDSYWTNDYYYYGDAGGGIHYKFDYMGYDIVSDDSYLIQKKERIYNVSSPTNYVETITDYDYDNFRHQQVSKTTTINSVGDTLVTNYKYPADYPGGNEALDYMVDNNMQAYPIETYSEVNSDITSAQLTEYRINTNSGNVVANSVKILEGEEPFSGSSFTESSVSGGNLTKDSHYSTIPEIAYDNYDDNNTLREYTSRGEDKVAVVWGYNKTQPVLKVEGMGYNSISSTIKTYLQNDNNLPSEWDDYQAVKTKVDMIISHLSTLFNNTSCQATLYTYAPAVGVTSVTLPNKTTTYYEYDSEGRLIKVLNDDGALVEYYDYHYVTGAPVELEMPVLGLDVEFLDFQAGSDGLSFSITSNTSWTITEDCSWLSLSQASGSGDGSVTVYATDNAGDAIRTDTIVVTNGQGLTKIITVSQEACELELSSNSVSFSSSGGNRTVTVLNDCCGWTASDNRSWISTSSSGDNLSIHASSNSSTSSRSGYVTVTSETGETASIYVSQSGVNYYTNVSPTSFSIPSTGSSNRSITVSSNESWDAYVYSDPYNIITSLSPGSGSGSGTISFSVAANDTTVTCSATIRVVGRSSGTIRAVSISQAAGTISYSLTVSPSSFSLSSGRSTNTITVSSNDSWSVSEHSDPNNMLSLSSTSGTGNMDISFVVNGNSTTSSRSATIRVTGNNSGITRYISINQAAASPTLSVSPTSFSVGALSSTKMINVSSNTSWVVSESESWIDLVYTTQGTGNGSFGISTSTLNSGSRNGVVSVVSTDGQLGRFILVSQDANY